jgi:antitoxin component YwqK of YwqJK toxin-antitoxin module
VDPFWLDRDRVDREIKAVDFSELDYDPGLGLYCYRGEPFTGACLQRYPDGKLENVVQNIDGLTSGVTVVWHPNGRIKLYRELENDLRHGVWIEWAEDGTKVAEQRYHRGRLVGD